MADNEQIGGISVGIAADLSQLDSSLDEASTKVSNWQNRQERARKIALKADVKINDDSLKAAKESLQNAVADIKKGLGRVPVRLDFGINRTTINRLQRQFIDENRKAGGTGGGLKAPVELTIGNADEIAKQIKAGMGKAPVAVDITGDWAGWRGDTVPTATINVVGKWTGWDGERPTVGLDGGGGGGTGGGGQPTTGAPSGSVVCPTCNQPFRRGGAYSAHRRAEEARLVRDRVDTAARPTTGGTTPQRASQQQRQQAKQTGEAVAEAIREEPVKVEPSKKQETKAQAQRTRQQVLRGEAAAPEVSDVATEAVAEVRAAVSARPPIAESERFQQGGQDVIECNQCNKIIPQSEWRSHRAEEGWRTRRSNIASRESEEIGRRQQAEVTLHRRGFGDVEREPERAEAISEFEFSRNMGSGEEMAERNRAWQRIEAAIGAGAEPTALLEEARIAPAEGSEAGLAEWLKTDEGRQFFDLLERGKQARRERGDVAAPADQPERLAGELEERGFGLGAALLRAGVAPGVPRGLLGGSRRPKTKEPDEAAGRIYEANLLLQQQEEAAEMEEIRKGVASTHFSERHPDIVEASNAAMEAAEEALGMPRPRGKRGEDARTERAQAVFGALRGTEDRPGLFEVARQLRATYRKPRSYRRLVTARNPRSPRNERDLAVLQTKAMIDRLLEEERATTGQERDAAEAAEKARETAEIRQEAGPDANLRTKGARRGIRGAGGASLGTPAATTEPRRRRSIYDPEAPIEIEPEEGGGGSAEAALYARDIAAVEVGEDDPIIVCPLCAARVPKSQMDSGYHFNEPRHTGVVRRPRVEGPARAYSTEEGYAPLPQFARAPEGGAFGLARARGQAAQPQLTEAQVVAALTEQYNREAGGRLRVKDLTPAERRKFQAANRELRGAGEEPATPAEWRAYQEVERRAQAEGIRVEPEPPAVIQEAVAPQEAGPPVDRRCALCGVTVRDWPTHEKTARHRRNLRKQATVEPEAGRAADVSSEEDKAKFNERVARAAQEQGIPPEEVAAATGGGGPTMMYCPICDDQVRASGHETSKQHFRALRAQSQGVAPSVISAEEEAAEAAAKEARFISPSAMKRMTGERSWQQLSREADKDMANVRNAITDINQFGREILEENPVRALSVAVSQVAVNLTGRAELKNMIGDINKEASRAQGLANDANAARKQVLAANKALANPEVAQEVKDQITASMPDMVDEATEAMGAFEDVMGAPLEAIEAAQKIPRRKEREARMRELEEAAMERERAAGTAEEPQTLLGKQAVLRAARPGILARTAAVSTVGIVGGTALFSAAMAAFNAAMAIGSAWVERMTEEMGGFAQAANTLATGLGQAALQSGRVSPQINQQLAQAGIGGEVGDRLAANLAPRIQGEMASQRITMMRDTLALNAQTLMARAEHPEVQNFAGVFQPTGGAVLPILGQTNIGAQTSVQEQMARMLGSQPSNTPWDILTAPAQAPALDFLEPIQNFFTGGDAGRRREASRQAARDTLEAINEQAARGGTGFQMRNPSIAGQTTGGLEAESAQIEALRALDAAPDFIERVESGDIALTNAQGELLTSTKDLAAFFDAFVMGARPSLEMQVESMRRPLEAQIFQLTDSLQRQLTVTNPIQRMQQQAMNPIQPFMTGLLPGASPLADRLAPMANAIRDQIRVNALRGWVQFVSEVRRSPVIDDPDMVIGQMAQVRSMMGDIAGEQAILADESAAFQMEQYNLQVFRAQRNISDLAALVENANGIEASRLGILNAENLALDRQMTRLGRRSQALSLEMNQRNINFQLATSQFTAAGATPAEAAAQREQAALEARFAQEQQDINMEMFGLQGQQFENQIQIVDEQNLRQFRDAVVDLDHFRRNFRIQADTAALSRLANDAGLFASQLMEDVNVQLGALESMVATEREITAQFFRDGAEELDKTAEEVKRVFHEVWDEWRRAKRNMGPSLSSQTDTSNPQNERIRAAASGMFGTFNMPTTLTVGEAGSETVAVLRNPRTVLTGGGGGGGSTLNITFSGAITVREEADLDKLARKIASSLNREANLYGFNR